VLSLLLRLLRINRSSPSKVAGFEMWVDVTHELGVRADWKPRVKMRPREVGM
jgi:hypothetical protein